MTQKFIDRDGLKVLWNQISLKDYPNNETLMAVIDAIDETKANKDELFSKSWNDLTDRTHYTEVIDPIDFAWDGNLSNVTTYETTYNDDTIYCVKVSDTVVVNKESRLSYVKVQRAPILTSTRDIPISYFVEENGYLCHSEEFPSRGNIEPAYIFIVTTEEGASFLGLPETGIYVNYKPSGDNASYYFEEFHMAGTEIIHKLDSKYLPTDTQYITTIPSEKYPLNSPEEFLELPNGFYNISEFGHKFPMVVSIPMGYDEDNNEIFEEKLLFGFISKRNTDILCYNLGFMFGGLEAYNGCFRAIGVFSLDGFGQKEFADFEGFLFSEVIGDDVLSTESSTLIGAINELNANKASTEYVDENFALKSDLDNIDLSGLETKTDAQTKYDEAIAYADTAVANLVNSAPETLDTLGELATAFEENAEVVDALNEAIVNKADVGHVHSFNDLEDKPFGEENTLQETSILNVNLTGFNNPSYDDTENYYVIKTNFGIVFKEGTRYSVVWDNTKYDNILSISGSNETVIVGDMNFVNYPFYLQTNSDGMFGAYTTTSESSHDIQVYEYAEVEVVKQLDEKYIPDTIARKSDIIQPDWNVSDESDPAYVKNRTHYVSDEKEFLIEHNGIVTTEDGVVESDYPYVAKNSTGSIVGVWLREPLTKQELVGCTMVSGFEGEESYEFKFENEEMIQDFSSNMYGDMGGLMIVLEDNATFSNVTYPKAGVYSIEGHYGSRFFGLYKNKVKTLDEKYLPETTKYQSDWSVNDESSAAFIKNRPFYSEIADVTLIDNQTLTSVSIADENPEPYEFNFPDNTKFINNGDECIVIFDSVEYVVSAFDMMYAAPMGIGGHRKYILLGEYDLEEYRPVFNKYPFNIMLTLYGDNADSFHMAWLQLANNEDSVKEHTVTIIHKQEQVTNLDEKFIPNSLKAGRNVAGKEFHAYDYDADKEVSYIAESNAEIFNDYENNIAIGKYSHAEGNGTNAIGNCSHAEGAYTLAQGYYSHAEGNGTNAKGFCSHAEGNNTIASCDDQHVQGRWNIEDAEGKYAHIVGNGKYTGYEDNRSNAHTLDWQGNAEFQGDVKANACGGEKPISLVELGQILSKDHIVLADKVNGFNYILEMHNGQLVSFCECESVEVVEAPSGIHYDDNGNISELLGMLFIAHCKDGSTREITNYSFVVDADYNVTLTYVENNVEFTATTDLDAVPA